MNINPDFTDLPQNSARCAQNLSEDLGSNCQITTKSRFNLGTDTIKDLSASCQKFYIPSSCLEEFLKLEEWMRPCVYNLLILPHYKSEGRDVRLHCAFTVRNLRSWHKKFQTQNIAPKQVLSSLKEFTGIATKTDNSCDYTKVVEVKLPENWKKVQNILLSDKTPITERVDLNGKKYRREADPKLSPESLYSMRINDLLEQLNTKSRIFAGLSQHVGDMKDTALTDNFDSEHRRIMTLQILESMLVNPQPTYIPVSNSARLYTDGASFMQLPRRYRKSLIEKMGWHSFDLRYCQFAVIAKVWNVKIVEDFLKTNQSLWQFLLNELNLEDNATNKDMLKTSVYALCFGASLTDESKEGCPKRLWADKDLYNAFLGIEIIKAVYDARELRKAEIRRTREITDAFGNKVDLGISVESLLAMEIQSYEVLIMLEVAEYLRDSNAQIALWIHDGIAIQCQDKYLGSIKKNLTKIVTNTCKKLGIQTSLENE